MIEICENNGLVKSLLYKISQISILEYGFQILLMPGQILKWRAIPLMYRVQQLDAINASKSL